VNIAKAPQDLQRAWAPAARAGKPRRARRSRSRGAQRCRARGSAGATTARPGACGAAGWPCATGLARAHSSCLRPAGTNFLEAGRHSASTARTTTFMQHNRLQGCSHPSAEFMTQLARRCPAAGTARVADNGAGLGRADLRVAPAQRQAAADALVLPAARARRRPYGGRPGGRARRAFPCPLPSGVSPVMSPVAAAAAAAAAATSAAAAVAASAGKPEAGLDAALACAPTLPRQLRWRACQLVPRVSCSRPLFESVQACIG